MKLAFSTLLFSTLLFGCENNSTIPSETFSSLDDINGTTFYTEEVIPDQYKDLYGVWRLDLVSGGFSGVGHDKNYDVLEIKNIGIYGLIKDGQVIETGRIDTTRFDNGDARFQITFDSTDKENGVPITNRFFVLFGSDRSLDLMSPCCDMYNYHYKRVR